MKKKPGKRLGEILVEDGLLTGEKLKEALRLQEEQGGLLGQVLVRLGHIDEDQLTASLAKQLKIPYLALAHYSVNMDTVRSLEESFCRAHMLVAFDSDEKRIYLGVADPLTTAPVDEIQQKMRKRTVVFITTPTEVAELLDMAFSSGAKPKELRKAG